MITTFFLKNKSWKAVFKKFPSIILKLSEIDESAIQIHATFPQKKFRHSEGPESPIVTVALLVFEF